MINTVYLRPTKGKCLQKIYDNYADRSGALGMANLSDVVIQAIGVNPDIEEAADIILDDCEYFSRIDNEAASATRIAGRVLYGGFFRKPWGHFLMGTVSRLWPLFGENPPEVDKIVFFADPANAIPLQGNYREFFELAGLLDKVVILPTGAYHFDTLLVPDPACRIKSYVSSEFMRVFDKVREQALQRTSPTLSTPKVLLTRLNWKVKNGAEVNVRKLDTLFAQQGYEAIAPETLPLADFISLLNSARQVATYSGSLAHNLLFCPATPAVILERCATNNLYQLAIDRMSSLPAVRVDAYYQPLLHSSTSPISIYALTPQLLRFARDNGFDVPDTLPQELEKPGKEFYEYLRACRRVYGYGVGLNHWEQEEAAAVAEAYHDSYPRYAPYLERCRPVMWYDFLSPRVWKRCISHLLNKNK